QSPLVTPRARRSRRWFVPGDAAEVLFAEERLSSMGSRIDRTMCVGAQFSPGIYGSSPSRPANLLDAVRGRDATSGLTTLATGLASLNTLDRTGGPQPRAQP